MQEHAAQARFTLASLQSSVQFEVAVLVVARNGKSKMREVHADLMRAPGAQLRLQQRIVADASLEADYRVRRRALWIDTHATFALRGDELAQGHAHMLACVVPGAVHQGEIPLLDLSLAQLFVQ